MLINVDFDGVLIPNIYEESLILRLLHESNEETSSIWNWYEKLVNHSLPLNIPMLNALNTLKERGNHIRLWTNRAYTLRHQTLNNLGEYARLFDSFSFYGGRKHEFKVEGIVIDNSFKNLSCSEKGGILYKLK